MTDLTETQNLEQAIAALESQRALLGDAIVETALTPLREKLASLTSVSSSPASVPQQRKLVTILFADMPGVATLSEHMDAEDVRDLTHQLWQRLDAIIVAHGGHIDKHMGDGVMALWGAEAASEDDAERALRAALAMQAEIRAHVQDASLPLALRVGINTGMVILGSVGTTGEFTALGDAVNLAARMEQSAAPGTVLVSVDTYRNVRGIFDVEPQAPITVKGKSEPVQTYIIKAARPRAFRILARGVEGVETQMVGRQAEMNALQSAFNTTLEQHKKRMVTVSADAGLGKSRLLFEFLAWVDPQPVDWWVFQGRAAPYEANVPYAYLRDIFSFRFEIQESDTLATVHEKFERGMRYFMPDDPRALEKAQVIGHLIGYDFSDSPHLKPLLADANQLRSQALFYLTQFFQTLARSEPVLILFDDLHWADLSSLDALAYLFAHLDEEIRLFALILARPTLYERYPGWGESWGFNLPVSLNPLSRDQSRLLVSQILQKVPDLPSALQELIVGGAEGNPFYVEELIKMLIDERVIQTGAETWRVQADRLAVVNVPPTLTGVLQARLDSLEPEERGALQRASVVGRIFWDSAVEALAEDVEFQHQLEMALLRLRNKELIFANIPSTFAGTEEFSFKHNILRDVTYATVLKRQRAAYHAGVAEWLSEVSGDRRGEYLPLMAEHFEKASETGKAVGAYIEAGERALGLGSFGDARSFFESALKLVDSAELDVRTIVNLTLHIGEAYFRLGEFPLSLRNTQKSLEMARYAGLTDFVAAALAQLGSIGAEMGDYTRAEGYLTEALPMVRESGAVGSATLAKVLFGLGNVDWRLGKLEQAHDYCAESYALAKEIGDTTTMLFALNRLAVVTGLMGDSASEERMYHEALDLARSVGSRDRAAVALNNLGALADERGDAAKARDYYHQAMRAVREIGAQSSTALYLTNLGHCEIKLKEWDAANAHLREGLAISTKIGATPWQVTAMIFIAQLTGAQGDIPRALALLGMTERHSAFSADHQRLVDEIVSDWGLGENTLLEGLSKGSELDWDVEMKKFLS